jgi:hypothetical protein
MRLPIPLKRRPLDVGLLCFFVVNLLFVSYIISLEQIVIGNPASFHPPIWPPRGAIKLIHWWEKSFDPLLWARPVWYRTTIFIDAFIFGPFYAAAIYAFARGREWIRTPSILWAGMMLANVTIILSEELAGPYASPRPLVVVLANLGWLVVPVLVTWRMSRSPHPFSDEMVLPSE